MDKRMQRLLLILILTDLSFGQSLGELIVEKDGDQVTIPKGDWVLAVNPNDIIEQNKCWNALHHIHLIGTCDANNADILRVNEWFMATAGELLGTSGDGIIIKNPKTDLTKNMLSDEIGLLFHGKYEGNWKYIRQGKRYGKLLALGCGILLGISSFTEGLGPFGQGAGEPVLALLAVPMGALMGICTVPAGVVFGFIQGKVAEGKAVEYIIGPDDWRIVHE